MNEPRDAVLPTEVIMPVRLALVVTVPAVSPEAVPVMLVPTRVDGVPRLGVTRVGEFENTKFPAVPVSSVSIAASSAEVSIDVDDTLLLKVVQFAPVRQPCIPAVAVSQLSVLVAQVSPVPSEIRVDGVL